MTCYKRVFFLLLFLGCAPGEPALDLIIEANPSLVILEPVEYDEVGDFSFNLINHSGASIPILDVSSGCTCTEVSWSSEKIPAHGLVKFSGHITPISKGPQKSEIVVVTGAGNISVQIRTYPKELEFWARDRIAISDLALHAPTEMSATFFCLEDSSQTFSIPEGSKPRFSIFPDSASIVRIEETEVSIYGREARQFLLTINLPNPGIEDMLGNINHEPRRFRIDAFQPDSKEVLDSMQIVSTYEKAIRSEVKVIGLEVGSKTVRWPIFSEVSLGNEGINVYLGSEKLEVSVSSLVGGSSNQYVLEIQLARPIGGVKSQIIKANFPDAGIRLILLVRENQDE